MHVYAQEQTSILYIPICPDVSSLCIPIDPYGISNYPVLSAYTLLFASRGRGGGEGERGDMGGPGLCHSDNSEDGRMIQVR